MRVAGLLVMGLLGWGLSVRGQGAGVAQVGSGSAGGPPAAVPVTAAEVEGMRRKLADWGQLGYYRAANAAVPSAGPVGGAGTSRAGSLGAVAGTPGAGVPVEGRVVFYGASMTENWGKGGSVFFPGKGYINRGIGGQTTAQMLVRFRQDVIDLHPQVVVILGGTNDVAGNTGLMTPEMTEGNWTSMAELARANGIAAVFASITPASDIPWRRGLHPAEKIRVLNAWLKAYCASRGLVYLDYYSVLADAEGGMKADLTVDGVHATVKGYTVMAPLAQAAVDRALATQAPQGKR